MMRTPTSRAGLISSVLVLLAGSKGESRAQEIIELGDRSANCQEDPDCFNRIHPEIPMAARAQPGATIVFHSRNASDFDLDPQASPDPRDGDVGFGTVHPRQVPCTSRVQSLGTCSGYESSTSHRDHGRLP